MFVIKHVFASYYLDLNFDENEWMWVCTLVGGMGVVCIWYIFHMFTKQRKNAMLFGFD